MLKPILVPLINANEPEALLAGIYFKEGQPVKKGEALFTLETTKSIEDVIADEDGYLVGMSVQVGKTVRAGEVLGYLAEQPDEEIPARTASPAKSETEGSSMRVNPVPAGLRITQPALALARQNNLDLTGLPTDVFITESYLRNRFKLEARPTILAVAQRPVDPTAILIYGGGGHGKSVIELVQALRSYRIVGIIDDGIPAGEQIMGINTFGGQEKLSDVYAQGTRLATNAVGGIGNITIRKQVFERLEAAGFNCPTLIHPTAYIEPSASLSSGIQIFPHAYVGSEASLGYGCIINTGAIVSHDCNLADYANISPGAILAGEVQIGEDVLVGMGVTINLRVKIGSRARIGNGATVKSDVPEDGIVRAGTTWPG